MVRRPLILGFLFALTLARADPPQLDALFPAGGTRGETIEVKAIGKFKAWPPQVWSDHKGLRIEPTKKNGVVTIKIDPKAEFRPALVRFFDANGSSAAKPFVVSTRDEIQEIEPNDQPSKAQDLNATPAGIVVNGILKKEDSDFFRIMLEKGQILVARADAYALGSSIDPFISLLDPSGHEVALVSDSHNLDPHLIHEATQSGTYLMQIFALAHPAATAVIFSGSNSAVYRLNISLGKADPIKIQADHREQDLADENGSRRIRGSGSVEGTLSQKGEVDRYVFEARKGSSWQFHVDAHNLRFPTDPVFALDRPSGALVKEVDDVKPTKDPVYQSSSMPVDGNYTIRIWDRFRRGGPSLRYRLVISAPEPNLRVTIDKENYVLETNGTIEMKLKLDRKNGHETPLVMEIDDLPEGVSLEDANATAKAKDATLVLRATMDAPPANLTFRLRVSEQPDGKKHFTKYSFLNAKSRGDYLVNETQWLHLTIKPRNRLRKRKKRKNPNEFHDFRWFDRIPCTSFAS
jgi:hypothetical protein